MTPELKLKYLEYLTDKLMQFFERLCMNRDFTLKIGEVVIESKPSERSLPASNHNLLDD